MTPEVKPVEDENNEQPVEDAKATEEATEGQKPEATTEEPAGSDEGAKKTELSPEDAAAALKAARGEAASYRERLRAVEKQLESMKSPEDIEALKSELTVERQEAERSLITENVALKYELPTELAELLRGETREEIEEHAKKLAKFATSSSDGESFEGGLRPGDGSDWDPVEVARAGRRNRW